MKTFQMFELYEAVAHAGDGGQALHLHTIINGHPLFKRYPVIAHLFDQNVDRLILTAKKLGVRIVKVEHLGTPKQHVDLCGKPLLRARAIAAHEKATTEGD